MEYLIHGKRIYLPDGLGRDCFLASCIGGEGGDGSTGVVEAGSDLG
jgi:hypothetical protein